MIVNTSTTKTQKNFIACAHFFVIAVIIIAVSALLGWVLTIDILKRIIPGTVAMNPLTALLFTFSGGSFLLIVSEDAAYKRLGKILALCITIAGLVHIIEYWAAVQNGIDSILFRRQLDIDRQNNLSNNMAANTAFCYVLLGIALFFMDKQTESAKRFSDFMAILILFISMLSIIGYLYVVDVFYAFLKHIPMALHTAFNFFLLGQAIMYIYPNRGMMAHITSNRAGGVVARKILPAVLLIPILLGGILLLLEWGKLFGADFGAAIFSLGIIVLFFVLCLPIIRSLNQTEEAKEKVEASLLQTVEDLKIRTEQLEISNKELESFSYSVSHDMRAPLRAINGYAQVLLHDYGDILNEDAKKIVHTISHNGIKMGDLIDALLRFAKIGKMGINRKPIDMYQLAKSVTEQLCALLNNKPEINIDPLPPTYGDETLVTQVFENLISNAIKYSAKKPNPQIRIGAMNHPVGMAYYIQDNGDGFDMRHYNKLFMVFHRLHGQEEFEGTGVGLAIVQKIILFHNGTIWAEGKKGQGATFYFTLGDYT